MPFRALLLILMGVPIVGSPCSAQSSPETPFAPYVPAAQTDRHYDPPWDFLETRQFDFWIGEWHVVNRFLQDDGTWIQKGSAVDKVYSILDGKALLEFWDGTTQYGPLKGFSLRYYDRIRNQWVLALNWPRPNHPQFFHLTGRFRHGRGTFFRTRTDTVGREIRARYTFSDITPVSFRWDAAYSSDSSTTWRINWIMELTRTAKTAAWPDPGQPFLTYDDGSLCPGEAARRFDALAGRWTGTYQRNTNGQWETTRARFRAYPVLDGCGLFDLIEYERAGTSYKQFRLHAYLPQRDAWVVLHLDNQPGTGLWYQSGRFQGNQITTTSRPAEARFSTSPRRKTTWSMLGEGRIRYETAVATDDGDRWIVQERVSLTRE